MKTTLIAEIAQIIQARLNCIERGNDDWEDKHTQRLADIEKCLLPSGSGIDCGTKIDTDSSTGEKVVLYVQYHHMNESGFYDGWTEHKLTVTPRFSGIDIGISGRNRNEIKDYLHEVYSMALTETIDTETMQIVHEAALA